ncbi:MAG TPA: hypothetical protein VG448_02835 [Solirubrobacterales bacterium]|nr:hypothetical protein [Solirubrobacterales bacterium]
MTSTLIAVVALVWVLANAAGASAISAPIHIAGTSGEGVYLRPEPNTSDAPIGWMPEGASPDYNCFAWGQNINGVPIWFNVNYGGVTGYYASFFDDSSYHSNEELTAKYGVPLCGSAPPSSPPPAESSPPAGGAGSAPGSLYFSPYPKNPHGPGTTGDIKAQDGVSWAHAPSPATITMNDDEWDRNFDAKGCPSPSSLTPQNQPAFDSGQISTLAAWSKARATPFVFLAGHPEWESRIHYIILFDPGNAKEWADSKCAQEYHLSIILRNWLIASRSNKLVIFSGEVTADADHRSVDGHGHAGIQNALFVPLKALGEPPGRHLRSQIVVCNYDHMTHTGVWIRFKNEMNQPPITVSTCPPVRGEQVVGWNP